MQLVLIVLSKVELLDTLLRRLHEEGVAGATFVDGRGMAKELAAHDEFRFLGSMRTLFATSRKESKVIFTVVPEEQVAVVSSVANEVTGGLKNPDTGILIALPVVYTEGLAD